MKVEIIIIITIIIIIIIIIIIVVVMIMIKIIMIMIKIIMIMIKIIMIMIMIIIKNLFNRVKPVSKSCYQEVPWITKNRIKTTLKVLKTLQNEVRNI